MQRKNTKSQRNRRFTTYLLKNKLDQACFPHDMAHGGFKDLEQQNSDKILYNKSFNIDKYPKYDGYKRGLASMVYKFFNNKTSGETVKNENISNKELGGEIDKPIIVKFGKKKCIQLSQKIFRVLILLICN